jgi:hypothetical protein
MTLEVHLAKLPPYFRIKSAKHGQNQLVYTGKQPFYEHDRETGRLSPAEQLMALTGATSVGTVTGIPFSENNGLVIEVTFNREAY